MLLGCIDLWVSCEWDYPDSTDIMESHRFIPLMRVEGGLFGWIWGLKELIIRSNGFTLSYEMMRHWDDYVDDYMDS